MTGYTRNKEYISDDCYSFPEKNESFRNSGNSVYIISIDYGFIDKSEKHPEYRGWVFPKNVASTVSLLEKQFNELSIKWKNETGVFSTTVDKINDTYLDIIALGKEIIPFILKDMQKQDGSSHWHTALKALSKENPINREDLGRNKRIKEVWLAWGRKKNLI